MLIAVDKNLFGEGHNNDLNGEGFILLDDMNEVADDELFDFRLVVVLDQRECSLFINERCISISRCC